MIGKLLNGVSGVVLVVIEIVSTVLIVGFLVAIAWKVLEAL